MRQQEILYISDISISLYAPIHFPLLQNSRLEICWRAPVYPALSGALVVVCIHSVLSPCENKTDNGKGLGKLEIAFEREKALYENTTQYIFLEFFKYHIYTRV